jgi:WD40 repeat protein
MSYCLNPGCQKPLNPKGTTFCQSCGKEILPLLRYRYQIVRQLGSGGFGRTFLAEDTDKLNEPCVVKQLVSQFPGTKAWQKANELFQEEAQRLQQLGEHPQIPALYAYFEQDNYLYLVQQLIVGQTLQQEVEQQGVFSEEKIWQLLGDLLPVLQFIHSHHVIHRDLKPENIIRRQSDGKPVLIDFGISKQLSATAIARPGTSIGSFGYASLEQMHIGDAYPASDLYSLGVTCFYLLTQIHPSQLWTEKGYSWVTDWRQYLKSPISQKLERVLDKLLQKDFQQRYQHADEVLRDFNRVQSIDPATIETQLPPSEIGSIKADTNPLEQLLSAVKGRKSKRDRSHPFPAPHQRFQQRLLAGGVILLLGLVGYGYWYFNRISTIAGHTGEVNTIDFSPDGRKFASGSDDTSIKIWNLSDRQELRTLKGHTDWVYSVAISPDGQTIVSGSKDNTVKVWDLNTGRKLHSLKGHTSYVDTVAISPDGQKLVSGSYDKTIAIWNLKTGEELRTLKGHAAEVLSVAISPDGLRLASGSTDRTIKLWNFNTGQEIFTIRGHTGDVNSLAFSPNGQKLASVSDDRTIEIWNPNTGRKIRTLTGHLADVNSVAFSPDGQKIATGSDDKTIRVWNLITGEIVATLRGHSAPVWSVAFSPDGQTLVSGSADKTIAIWHLSQ